MLKLKLQYFGQLMWRAVSLEKDLMLGKTEGRRRRGWQRMRWSDGITDSMDVNFSKLWETVEHRGAWSSEVHGVTKGWVSDWTVMTRRTADLCVNCPTSRNNYFIYSIQVDSWLLHVAKSNTSYLVISRGTISFFLNTKRSMLIPYFKSMYS